MKVRFTLALVLAAAPAFAQPARQAAPAEAEDMAAFERELDALLGQGGLTADQAAARAAKASPTVRARVAQIDAALANARTAELALVPRVDLSATATKLSPIDPVELAPGFAIEFINHSYKGEASVAVPISEYLWRFPKVISAAKRGTEAARLSARTSELDASQEARMAYYEWIRAKLQVVVANRQLAQIRATLGQVRALAEAQRVSKADLMRVESQEAQGEQIADQLANLAALREEQLRLLIGAPANEPLVIGEDIRTDVAVPGEGKLDDLMGNATQNRLEFRAIDVGIEAKEAQRQADKASLLPSLSAFATAQYSRPNERVFPQVDEFRFTWLAGVQLSWSLNDALVSNAQDRRYRAEINELRANRENLERGTRIAVLAAQQSVSIAQRALATSQKGLAAAEEAYRVRQALLQAQRATAVELVDAEAELTRARIAALDARVDLRLAISNLAHAIGADVK